MRRFNPNIKRDRLADSSGVKRYLSKTIEEEKAYNALGMTARMMLGAAIQCILVGFRSDATALLTKARDWLELAISQNEKPRLYCRWGTEAERHGDLALCNWLLLGVHDEANSKEMIDCREAWRAERGPLSKTEVGYLLHYYLDAYCYEQALDLFGVTSGLKAPAAPSRIRGEATMAYLIASVHEQGEFSIEDMRLALDRFLRLYAGRLLADGQFSVAARWMKIAFVNEASSPMEPEKAILKAYDYLPDIGFPGYSSIDS